MREQAEKLHAIYIRETGLDLPMRMGRDRAWFHWMQSGFTEADLVMVVRFLKRGIAAQERNPGCLRFRNLIEMLDYFDEELAMAKKAASARTPRPSMMQTEQHVGAIRRTVEVKAPEEQTGVPELVKQEMARFKSSMRAR